MAEIQHKKIREIIDRRFTRTVDELNTCYYNNWKHGQQKFFVARRDPQTRKPTLVFGLHPNDPDRTGKGVWNDSNQSWEKTAYNKTPKELFDKLHGMLWHKYTVKFDEVNQSLSEAPADIQTVDANKDRRDPRKVGYYIDDNGNEIACKVEEKNYNRVDEQGNIVEYRHQTAQSKIAEIESEGLELDGEKEETDTEEVTSI